MREPEGVYKLCIHDPNPLDGGRFIVQASNKAGKEEIRKLVKFLGKQHYKYLPGIYHADPKKSQEEEEGEIKEGEQTTDQQPATTEVQQAAPPAEEEEEMVSVMTLFLVKIFNNFLVNRINGEMLSLKRKRR